jgi:hypothetical protein
MKELLWVPLNKDVGIKQLHDSIEKFRADRPMKCTAIHFSHDWMRFNAVVTTEDPTPDFRDSVFLNELALCLDVKYKADDRPAGSFGYLFGMVVYFERPWRSSSIELRIPPSSCVVYLD